MTGSSGQPNNAPDRHTRRAALAALCLAVCAAASFAAEPRAHRHEPLTARATLTLSGSVDAAVRVYPDTQTLDARLRQAEAWQDRGRSLLSARPSWSLRIQTDRFGTDAGLDEYEAGVDLPFWTAGGRRSVRAYGSTLAAEVGAASGALRWSVAGEVRAALWAIALAEAERALAEQARQTAAQLLRTIERRHQLGDLAQADVLLSRSSYLEFESALIEAEAALLDAERTWRFVTGLDHRPDFVPERVVTRDAITSGHPALTLANAAVQRAEADVAVAERTLQAGPTVFLGTRHERPAGGTEFDDAIGIIVSVPFGGGAHRRTEISAAARMLAEARADRDRRQRELTMALHEAAHRLDTVREHHVAARERVQLADRQEAMAASAYEQGELDIMDLLRIRAAAIEARRNAVRLDIEEKRQSAFFNQAAGEIP